MEISDLAVRIIIVFIPGFLTTLLFRYLSTHKEYTNFYFIVLSSLFGISNYLLLEILFQIKNLFWNTYFILTLPNYFFQNKLFVGLWGSIVDRTFKVESIEVVYSSLIAIVSAFFYSYIYQKKLILRFANSTLKITGKSGDDDTWSYYLNSKGLRWVWVRDFNNSLTYFGEVIAFSDSGSKREVVLRDVSVYRINSKKELYSLNSVYISLNDGMYAIEEPY